MTGRISALSTAGSILGSFLPVLILIPNIGTRRTFAVLSLALLLVVLLGVIRLRRVAETALVLAAAVLIAFIGWRPIGPIKPSAGLLYEHESAHNYIQVVDAGFERQLRLNEGEGIHSVYRPQGGLADGIWDYSCWRRHSMRPLTRPIRCDVSPSSGRRLGPRPSCSAKPMALSRSTAPSSTPRSSPRGAPGSI